MSAEFSDIFNDSRDRKRDDRESESLKIAKQSLAEAEAANRLASDANRIALDANRIASEAKASVRAQAWWCLWATIIAATTIIISNKGSIHKVYKFIVGVF